MFPLVLVSNFILEEVQYRASKSHNEQICKLLRIEKSRSIHFSLHETTPKEAIEDRILSVTLVPLFQPKRTQNKNSRKGKKIHFVEYTYPSSQDFESGFRVRISSQDLESGFVIKISSQDFVSRPLVPFFCPFDFSKKPSNAKLCISDRRGALRDNPNAAAKYICS